MGEAQRRANVTGAMVSLEPGECVCEAGIAGNMHVDSFVEHEALDPLDLPANAGGLSYLGRIRLDPIDDGFGNRTVVADHWMKWAFHFLVDADPGSPSYGQPVRLYASGGARFVYSEWTVGDPRMQNPDLFNVPRHCISLTKFC